LLQYTNNYGNSNLGLEVDSFKLFDLSIQKLEIELDKIGWNNSQTNNHSNKTNNTNTHNITREVLREQSETIKKAINDVIDLYMVKNHNNLNLSVVTNKFEFEVFDYNKYNQTKSNSSNHTVHIDIDNCANKIKTSLNLKPTEPLPVKKLSMNLKLYS